MKRWLWLIAIGLALVLGQAEAKRLGGGGSFGRQSGNVAQRQAAPAQSAGNSVTKPAAAGAPAAAKRPWGTMLGALAAGFGLAWLANSLGLGAAMGQFLLFAVLALLVLALLGWLRRARRTSENAPSRFAFQGSGSIAQPLAPHSYRPENVGNDASARPWERGMTAFDGVNTGAASMIGSGLNGKQTWGIPTDFDSAGFLHSAKANFVSLQAAWDKADIAALRAMMTDAMLKEIQSQLGERAVHTGVPVNLTEVVMIDASLLGIEDLGGEYMASVEFSGLIREEPSSGPSPFREVWNMIKPKNGNSGWLVAGVQALQ